MITTPLPDWVTWATLAAAVASAISAGVATWIAVLTLKRIDKQVQLANDQIAIAREEVGYVKTDLENNQRQMAEFMRRPALRFRGARTIRYQVGAQDADTIDFTLYVSNVGTRGADHHLIELLIPRDDDYNMSKAAPNDPSVRVVRGEPYIVYPSSGDWLFPNGVPAVHGRSIIIHKPLQQIRFLWRMYDEFAKYPSSNYGSFEVTINKQMADLSPDENGPAD